MFIKRKLTDGFTLIELMVVISIIGVLASVVISSLNDARRSAKDAATKQQLRNINIGIQRLIHDTGRMPNGCSPYSVANPEVPLSSNQAGLTERPVVQNNGSHCQWSTQAVAAWNGPYVEVMPLDSFNKPFFYDPDYIPFRNCADETELPVIQAIVSRGEDGAWYSCDDLYIQME